MKDKENDTNPLTQGRVMSKKQICTYYGISANTLRSYLKRWGMYEELKNVKLVFPKYLRVIAEYMKD